MKIYSKVSNGWCIWLYIIESSPFSIFNQQGKMMLVSLMRKKHRRHKETHSLSNVQKFIYSPYFIINYHQEKDSGEREAIRLLSCLIFLPNTAQRESDCRLTNTPYREQKKPRCKSRLLVCFNEKTQRQSRGAEVRILGRAGVRAHEWTKSYFSKFEVFSQKFEVESLNDEIPNWKFGDNNTKYLLLDAETSFQTGIQKAQGITEPRV